MRTGEGAYAPLDQVDRRLERLGSLDLQQFKDAKDWAAARFVAFVQAHPFADGNGRTGRALIQLDLGAAALIDAPVLPLGPVMYAHAPTIWAALMRGDGEQAQSAVRAVIDAAWRAAQTLGAFTLTRADR